ncbi:SET domain-containing protein SmydA-8-like [Chelonus insularis]|uniref:SET domain-containing protein SmydA-8-like n=1 Tax=Chelonus insularis TaxID=460826 RepID=UPI00158B89CF|nr:SET domain-containing protein SmydA-8-like [Chelonus insularis]
MSENLNQMENCAICQQSAKQKCGSCKSVFYCSREHQKLDWKKHSKQCRLFEIAEDKNVGRHLIATRKIEAGEVILIEKKPLVAAPQQGTNPVCLSCYVSLTNDNATPCQKCGWPLCNNCQEHGEECQFTVNHRDKKVSITEFGIPHPTYKCIGIVRALSLRQSDPESYQKLLNLESHCDAKNSKRHERLKEIADFVMRFFKVDDINEEEIIKIAGILEINGHEVPTSETPHVAVYDLASYFEHDCRANCSKSFTENGGIIIRSALPICKGEHITMCYVDPLWGVTNRRHYLLETKLFECKCGRCSDPTEFGSMFNALKCRKGECGGSLLPETFITTNKKLPDYVCAKCQDSTSWDTIEIKLESIGIELARMKKDDIDACKQFIQRHSQTLHDNHFYLVDVKLALVQLIGQQDGGLPALSDELLNEKISLCKKLDQLLQTLVPAEHRIRGLILFEAHAGIAEYGRRQGKDELRGMLMLSKQALEEAYQLLRYEPEVLPEGKVARIAKKNISEMNLIIKALSQAAVTPM